MVLLEWVEWIINPTDFNTKAPQLRGFFVVVENVKCKIKNAVPAKDARKQRQVSSASCKSYNPDHPDSDVPSVPFKSPDD